jgi:hypothetical protein
MNWKEYVRKWSCPNLRSYPGAGLVREVLLLVAYSLERMELLLGALGLRSRLQLRRDYNRPRHKWMK